MDCKVPKMLQEAPLSQNIVETELENQLEPFSSTMQIASINGAASYTSQPNQSEGIPFAANHTAPSLRILPRWLKYSRQVLRFYGRFTTKIYDGFIEKTLTRFVTLHFYLEDGTIQITEPEVDNSGIKQGLYLKRHLVPCYTENRFLGLNDFKLGQETKIYSQIFYLYDCDDWTRQFCDKNGYDIGTSVPVELCRDDQNGLQLGTSQKRKTKKEDISEWKEYRNVVHGGARRNLALKQYLKHDRMVLRFYAFWKKDPNQEESPFCIILYFLADDTMQIVQTHSADDTRNAETKVLLRKLKPSRTSNTSACPGLSTPSTGFVKIEDLVVGNEIVVFDRSFYLYDCDEFTRRYYNESLSMKQPPAIHQKLSKSLNIFGQSKKDSAPTEILQQKQESIQQARAFLFGTDVSLAFDACLHKASGDEKLRKFKFLARVSDDDIIVRELKRKNSGRVEGTFASSGKKLNPTTGEYYTHKDFQIGNIVVIFAVSFEIVGIELSTVQYLLERPTIYPKFAAKSILARLKHLKDQLKAVKIEFVNVEELIENLLSIDKETTLDGNDYCVLRALYSPHLNVASEDVCELKAFLDALVHP